MHPSPSKGKAEGVSYPGPIIVNISVTRQTKSWVPASEVSLSVNDSLTDVWPSSQRRRVFLFIKFSPRLTPTSMPKGLLPSGITSSCTVLGLLIATSSTFCLRAPSLSSGPLPLPRWSPLNGILSATTVIFSCLILDLLSGTTAPPCCLLTSPNWSTLGGIMTLSWAPSMAGFGYWEDRPLPTRATFSLLQFCKHTQALNIVFVNIPRLR